jgi:hypothetical protein
MDDSNGLYVDVRSEGGPGRIDSLDRIARRIVPQDSSFDDEEIGVVGSVVYQIFGDAYDFSRTVGSLDYVKSVGIRDSINPVLTDEESAPWDVLQELNELRSQGR